MKKTLTISSSLKNLSHVEKFVEEICAERKVSQDVFGNIIVSLAEGATNAIVHGNKSDENKAVEISCWEEDNGQVLSFQIKDKGEGFDFALVPDPLAPQNIEKPSGRGVFLMNALADNVIYSNNGKTVELKFRV